MAMFTYISDLPPQVQQLLSKGLQQTWLETFNAAMTLTANEAAAAQTAWITVLQTAYPGQVVGMPNDNNPPVAEPAAIAMQPSPTMTYCMDISGMEFAEGEVKWLQAMPVGMYQHPVHGELDLGPQAIQQFADNVKANVRGQELDIDYDHKAMTMEAAGWVKDAEARLTDPDPAKRGLWLAVEFTADALTKLKNKAYRYFSPEFQNSWTHPKTNEKYNNVLFGGALTNRPFLKDILPVNLSEVMTPSPGGVMERAELLELLGLQDSATDDEITSAVEVLKNPPKADGDEPKVTEPVSASENAELVKLAESNPVIATMLAEREEDRKRLVALETSNRLSEVTMRLSELNSDKKAKFALAPNVIEQAKTFALKLPVSLSDDFFKILGDARNGLVELGERHLAKPGDDADPAQEFLNKIEAKVKEDSVSYADATHAISLAEPELFEAYRASTYVKERA